MSQTPDAAAALAGALRLFRYQDDGARLFVATPDGFWHSFWAIALTVPLFAITMALGPPGPPGADPVVLWLGLIEIYAILAFAFPLIILRLAPAMEVEGRALGYLIASHWLTVPANLLQTTVAALGELPLPPGMAGGLQLGAVLILAGNRWWVTTKLLGVSGILAAGIVMLDFLLTVVVFQLVLGRLF